MKFLTGIQTPVRNLLFIGRDMRNPVSPPEIFLGKVSRMIFCIFVARMCSWRAVPPECLIVNLYFALKI